MTTPNRSAYIERLNATFRQRLPWLTRRTRCLAAGLLWRYGRQPLLVYYAMAAGVGLVSTAVYRLVVPL